MRKIIYCFLIILITLFLVPIIISSVILNVRISAQTYIILVVISFVTMPLIASVTCGIFSGINIRKMWFMPIVVLIAFIISARFVSGVSDLGFLLYACSYLFAGYVAMIAAHFIKRIVKKKK